MTATMRTASSALPPPASCTGSPARRGLRRGPSLTRRVVSSGHAGGNILRSYDARNRVIDGMDDGFLVLIRS